MDSVNYIWLCNSDYYNPENFSSTSPVPAEYINNADIMAQKNPETSINIWVNLGEMSDRDIVYISRLAEALPKNCYVRDLNEIPAFKTDPIFAEKSNLAIWGKVDLARLYVIDHVLSDERTDTAYYSDFGIPVKDLSSDEITEKLAKKGCVFSYMKHPTRPPRIENGFFGINKSLKNIMRDLFIPRNKKLNMHDGWTAFWHCADKICGENLLDVEALLRYAIAIPSSTRGRVHFSETAEVKCLQSQLTPKNPPSLKT
ncbi:MAG: hypothetical protein PHW76_05745 [Alphaproteobacteria bacterium]|nr:hypothetical protein [Alphaproteobacteria bacterium]